jgi:chemosensory pili system protein ChpA (sensor histidine kinase/response regulator)
MRAMVQLPTYLDRVLAGGRDLALVLLPLLNDLRAVRGSPLLSEGTLLLLNLKSEQARAARAGAAAGERRLTVRSGRASCARSSSSAWSAGSAANASPRISPRCAQVAARMEQVATTQPVFQLWWVVGRRDRGAARRRPGGSVSVKRLLGLADREIKRLYEHGEAALLPDPPVELLNNLLYYVARASSTGPRVTAVRQSFRLDELLPVVDQAIDEARENLSAPSIKLMQTVAAAIREDLARSRIRSTSSCAAAAASPASSGRSSSCCARSATRSACSASASCAAASRARSRASTTSSRPHAAERAALVEIAATLIGIEDRPRRAALG